MGALTISSLPTELLVAIAVAGQEDNDDSNWQTRSKTWKAEWTLSHLSQRFRDVVVGAPELWTLTEADFDVEGSAEILNLYLERSRTSKISTTLRGESGIMEDGFLQKRVIPHVNRMWRLRIALDRDLETLLAPFRDVAAPYLQHLEAVCTIPNEEAPPVVMFSSGAPLLNFLKVDGFTLQLPTPAWTASLTHLELCGQHDSDISNFAAITAQCPLLEHLLFDMIHFPPGATRVHLPTLNFLHISIAEEEPAERLIEIVDIFDAPALTELVVHGTHADQISLLLCSTGLPHSSFPALTTVSFIYTGSCHCEIREETRPSLAISSPPIVFPALSHLTLINQCYTEYLIRDILGPASEPWPLLKIITLGVKNDSFEDVRGALETIVISKRERGDPLPKVQILRAPASLANWNEKNSWDMETAW